MKPFRIVTLLVLPLAAIARDISLIRVVDEGDFTATSSARVGSVNVGSFQKSFFDSDAGDQATKKMDFAASGCDCSCDCTGNSDDCVCSCKCTNPEDETTAVEHKLMEEKRRLRLENRRKYERELQEISSITEPAPSPPPTPEQTVGSNFFTVSPHSVSTEMPSDMPSSNPTESPIPMPSAAPSTKSDMPSDVPSWMPFPAPSSAPTPADTVVGKIVSAMPSASPVTLTDEIPSHVPSTETGIIDYGIPSDIPSSTPSSLPTISTSVSGKPVSGMPSSSPTISLPSAAPSAEETVAAKQQLPTDAPTAPSCPTTPAPRPPAPSPMESLTNGPTDEPSPAPSYPNDPECPQTPAPAVSAPGGRKLSETKKSYELDQNHIPHLEAQDTFDFLIAGFPKCGTTTLLKAFAAHNETDMLPSEKCTVASPNMADLVVLRKLDETIMEMSVSPNVKRSFKCPTAIYNHMTITRMEKHSPAAKFIIGVRHPILMIQSFYNYRVTEIYLRGLGEEIPSFEKVVSAKVPWKGVSMEATRFELFLKQFGKTDMSPQDMYDFIGHPEYQLAVKPSKFTIFLYTLDQIEDIDEVRNMKFRRTLQHYLGLSGPLAAFGHENRNHQVGDDGYKETIDICDGKYKSVRLSLLEQAKKSADWIRGQFIKSRDVWVANEDHFVATLDSWSTDPCSRLKQ